jgi:hypothetical protein
MYLSPKEVSQQGKREILLVVSLRNPTHLDIPRFPRLFRHHVPHTLLETMQNPIKNKDRLSLRVMRQLKQKEQIDTQSITWWSPDLTLGIEIYFV